MDNHTSIRGAWGCTARRLIMVFLILTSLLLVSSFGIASSQEERVVMGRVVDARTNEPLVGVTIHIVGRRTSHSTRVRYDSYLTTNETGQYNTTLGTGYYWIAVLADDPETQGVDYVPGFMSFDMSELGSDSREIVADFQLEHGASVYLIGSPEFVEIGGVAEQIAFAPTDTSYNVIWSSGLATYYDANLRSFIGLGAGQIVVPSDTPIAIVGTSSDLSFYVDNDSLFFKFPQGSLTQVDIGQAVMKRNISVVRDSLTSTWLYVEQLAINGIDVQPEIDDLNTAFGYADSARMALREDSYSQCFINLRAAYIMNEDVLTRTSSIRSDVTFSPVPLSFLLVLSGFGLASTLIERNPVRIGTGFLLSTIFLGFYYYISPGWRLTEPVLLLASCGLAASTAIGLTLLLPKVRADVVTPSGIALTSSITSTFSLATRNLKRRRLRSVLILTSIITLVFGFTVFTSFQIQTAVASGRPSQQYPRPPPPTGLMIVAPPGPAAASGLPTSMVDALKEDPLVGSVAPKTESSPTYMDAQLITEDGDNLTIRGVLGISSEEAKMSHLDAAIIKGHYLQEEEHAIMISAIAANQLHVSAGDKVQFWWGTNSGISLAENFTIAGVLDDVIFEQVVDLDGQPIRPYVILNREKVYLSTDSIALFNWKTLIDLKLGLLTRINVQPINQSDIIPLAVHLVGKWRWFVYASSGKEVQLYYYRRDPMLSGGTAVPMLLVLVGLNVLACTLNAVYERRKEIATLSLVGLNPSQISYIFLAEAGLVAFIGGVLGYLIGLGGPRILLSLGGPGFLTEKISWTWSLAVILMAVVVSVSASVIPALKASTIATPKLPLKWKLDYLPATKDVWMLHIPQLVSEAELGRFFRFIEGKFEELQLLRTIPEKMEKMDIVDESDQEKDVKRFIFAHSFAQEGSRAFRTENELVAARNRGSSTYTLDLSIKMAMLYNYEPMEVVRKTASAVRRLMLQWVAAPSSARWGQSRELVKVENLSITSGGKLVIRGISLDVIRGEILGLTGTGGRAMILAIAGLLKPNGGSIQLGGIDTYSRREEVRKTMGILLQGAEPYDGMTLRRNLLFMAKLEGISDAEKKVDEIIERCDLKEFADETLSVLSQAIKRRLMIAQTLINKPTLLLLEDPLSGLKDNEAGALEVLLKGLSRWEGITIICSGISADDLGFCNRIGVMRDGSMETVIEIGGEGVE